jgi:hypothetical protein
MIAFSIPQVSIFGLNLLVQLWRSESEAKVVWSFQLLLPVDAPVDPAELDVGNQDEVLK